MGRGTMTHAEEQRRYREGLRKRRVPEVGRVDRALAAALYGQMRSTRAVVDLAYRQALGDAVRKAVRVLIAQGFDPRATAHVVHRRLGTPNPSFEDLLKASETASGGPGKPVSR